MEYPKPAKRLPKPKTKIRQVSAKQAKNLRIYEAGKREKYGNTPDVCTGCGRVGQISCSHLVARSHSFDLVAEILNHERQCFSCADLTERGQYFMLNNGLKLLERLYNGLGEPGKQRFRYVINQWQQNLQLWEQSTFFDPDFQ